MLEDEARALTADDPLLAGLMAPFHVVIPARYASTRLPGKPLLDIGGRPMIQHVVERACASGADRVLVATDDASDRSGGARSARLRAS